MIRFVNSFFKCPAILRPSFFQTFFQYIGTIEEAEYNGPNDKGYFLCKAVVFYSNALFIANFAVQPSGMIEMLDDEPIVGDLPVKIECPVS